MLQQHKAAARNIHFIAAFVMAALRSRCGHYVFALWFYLLFSLV